MKLMNELYCKCGSTMIPKPKTKFPERYVCPVCGHTEECE